MWFGFDFTRSADIQSCRESRSHLFQGLSPQRTLFDALAAKAPNVAVFDSFPSLCDAEFCYQADERGFLFWSWAHVNERGSLRVLKNFLPWFNDNLATPVERP
jgi:hypothetical protein